MTNSSNQGVSTDIMSYYDTTGPIGETKALPIAALGGGRGRKIVYTKDIEQLAINTFEVTDTMIHKERFPAC